MTFGLSDDDGVDQTDAQVAIALEEGHGPWKITGGVRVEAEQAVAHILRERARDVRSEVSVSQVIDFRQHRPRHDPCPPFAFEQLSDGPVVAIPAIEKGEDSAGVGDDHFSLPKPSSSSSVRSLRLPARLAPMPMLLGRRRFPRVVEYTAIASRMTAACVCPDASAKR